MPIPVLPTDVLMGVYFDSMNAGYLSGNKPAIIPEQNFTKGFRYRSPCMRFTVEDRWHFTDGETTVGETLMFHHGIPVWSMQYRDRYDPSAIPVLKAALTQTCQTERTFIGGRGPTRFEHGAMYYTNIVSPGSTFDEFNGVEGVGSSQGSFNELGGGLYMGGRFK